MILESRGHSGKRVYQSRRAAPDASHAVGRDSVVPSTVDRRGSRVIGRVGPQTETLGGSVVLSRPGSGDRDRGIRRNRWNPSDSAVLAADVVQRPAPRTAGLAAHAATHRTRATVNQYAREITGCSLHRTGAPCCRPTPESCHPRIVRFRWSWFRSHFRLVGFVTL